MLSKLEHGYDLTRNEIHSLKETYPELEVGIQLIYDDNDAYGDTSLMRQDGYHNFRYLGPTEIIAHWEYDWYPVTISCLVMCQDRNNITTYWGDELEIVDKITKPDTCST